MTRKGDENQLKVGKGFSLRPNIQLLSKIFIDSDFCHNCLHTLYLFECL